MKSFFDGIDNEDDYDEKKNNCYGNDNMNADSQKAHKQEQFDTQSVQGSYEKYKNMSQNELMQNLLSEVQKQKNNGTFDYDKLAQSIDNFSGMLNPNQKENIKNLLKQIK